VAAGLDVITDGDRRDWISIYLSTDTSTASSWRKPRRVDLGRRRTISGGGIRLFLS